MAIRLHEDLTQTAAQQALLAQQEAETKISEAFGIEEARKLADVMKGKLYLSDEELSAALKREAEEARTKPSERRTTAATRNAEGATDEVAAREVTEAARPTSIGAVPEGQRREAVTPVLSGIGIEKNEPVKVTTAGEETREDSRTSLMRLAMAATIGGSDLGDHHAIAHLKDLMQYNPSQQELLTAITNVEKAKAAADKRVTYRTKDGKKVTATTVEDDCHTETSYTVEQEYSGSILSGLFGSDADSRKKGGGIIPTTVALGALATANSGSGREGLRNLVSSGLDTSGLNPFSLSSPQTPAQELVQGLRLFHA